MNHIDAQKVQEATKVILSEFPVNSTLAIVLFDSGASHSFISSKFSALHKLPTVVLKNPKPVRSPAGNILCHL